ncbi:HNH endonuclease [Pedobacter sp. R20-19]|uniref:HNH endonuclease n=1 Tax=Pedobacter sp. R20-19 TaxID=1270196 RepID=UPI0004935434|nr:HNH endonuclease [Pedobacter sp. R20-19]
MKISFELDELNSGRAENFFTLYDFENIVGDTTEKYYLGTKTIPRCCRFCNKKEPIVTFKKDAHVIPQFMGNKKLLSYFECDACNELFSQYESSFANYIGASRTISQIPGQGKHKVPKFRDKKTGFTIELGEKSLKMGFVEGHDEVSFDEKNNKLFIKTVRPSYVPLHIAKVILKIGICLLKEEDLEDYKSTISFIFADKYGNGIEGNELLKVKGYFLPGPPKYPKPFVQLYTKKKTVDELIPSKHVVVYYGNYVFQMCLPFCKTDNHLNGQQISFPLFPLLVDNSYFDTYGPYQKFNLDTTSNEKKVNEPHSITFSYKKLIKPELLEDNKAD